MKQRAQPARTERSRLRLGEKPRSGSIATVAPTLVGGGQGGAGPLGAKYGSAGLGGAMWDIYQADIGWKVFAFVRRANTTEATLDRDDFTQALVRRKLPSNDNYVSGIESGTEVCKGTGRLDTRSCSVAIG
ncbi:hypothetical protein [Streptomyces sp. NPDC050263]|uniref:GH12 family glycosyl hydrolase domain-containing protein n=1 Tax=Streptomyces sp. NPDC050263 TaxID=3155037 RepID=UPI00341E279E